MTVPPEKSISEKLEVDDGEIDRFDISDDNVEHAKKSGKSKA